MAAGKPLYQRIVLKLSGEALQGDTEFGIDPKVLLRFAHEIKEVVDLGVQTAVVIGGGNLFRGAALSDSLPPPSRTRCARGIRAGTTHRRGVTASPVRR